MKKLTVALLPQLELVYTETGGEGGVSGMGTFCRRRVLKYDPILKKLKRND